MFELHPTLAADSVILGELPLSLVLLARDRQYPWLILVPRVSGMREIYELGEGGSQQLLRESCALAELMQRELKADKLNIAAIGNMVPQLHLHHVARFRGDAAWPKPIWGVHPAQPYSLDELALQVSLWRRRLAGLAGFVAAG